MIAAAVIQFSNASSESPSGASRNHADTSVDVVVVGAGWSGLYTAKTLSDEGYSVAVVEAMPRLGGRSFRQQILTDTANPLWIDEGGQWVGPTQTNVLELLKEYNIELYESPHALGDIAVYWNNASIAEPGPCWDCLILPTANDTESAEALYTTANDTNNSELRDGLNALIDVMAAFRQVVDTIDPAKPWEAPNADYLDSITFTQWVDNQTDNELARTMMEVAVSEQGATMSQGTWTSALHIARQLAAAPQPETPEKWLVKGAMGQMPQLLANNITANGGIIILDSPVHLIQQDANGVTVSTENRTIDASAVVVAMPPHLTGRIQYEPPMPPARDQLTQRAFMGSITKVIAVYDTPFWRNVSTEATSGNTFVFGPQSTGAVQTAFDISPPLDIGGGGVGILASFIAENATDYFNMTDDEREKTVLKSFAEFYGPKALEPIDFVQMVWAKEPFVGGAYGAVLGMGVWTSALGPALTQPVGRIYWAGTDSSSRWPGFYDGALSAAKSAIAHVKSDVKATGEYHVAEGAPAPGPSGGSGGGGGSSPASGAVQNMAGVVGMVMMLVASTLIVVV